MSLYSPARDFLLARKVPTVRLLDVKSDTTDLTTYTFSACSIGELGSCPTLSGDNYFTHSNIRVAKKELIAVIVHGEDAATAFGVSSVTIGGVGGTEWVDRGGGTSAINTAIYIFPTDTLQDISNTDVVVTWGEAITGCAIGIVAVSGIGLAEFSGTGSSTATGDITVSVPVVGTSADHYQVGLLGSSCIGLELFQIRNGGAADWPWTVLYDLQSAEFSFAAAWSVNYAYAADRGPFQAICSWSGTAGGDAAIVGFV